MPAMSKFETFYVQGIASEFDGGFIFLPEKLYVDPFILNEILKASNPFDCNTVGDMEVWTTDPSLKAKSDWECINYVSESDLKEWKCESLFESLVTGDGEYTGVGDDWYPEFLSVTWGNGDQKAVEKAIDNFLSTSPSQADVDDYKRLKTKLGL